jgi:chitinase
MLSLPTKPVGVYWPNFGSVERLINYPNTSEDGNAGYNVLILFSAYPAAGEAAGGDTGAVVYGQGSMGATPWNNRVADIATCRARGTVVLLSVGGASRQVYVTSQARADALFDSLKTINEALGGSGTTAAIDGIDWNNFELGGSDPVWMTYVSLRLKEYYGSGFIISAPPAAFPPLNAGSQVESDRLLLATMHRGGTYGTYSGTALDWFCPQFYDGVNTQTHITNALNYYDDTITVAGDATLGTSSASVTLPNSKMGIGFGIQTPTWSDSGYWTSANAITAYNTTTTNRGTVRGAFNWAAQLDLTHVFATDLGPVINPTGEGGISDTTLTTVKTFNTKARATLKRINGILVSAIKSWNGKQ